MEESYEQNENVKGKDFLHKKSGQFCVIFKDFLGVPKSITRSLIMRMTNNRRKDYHHVRDGTSGN